MKPGCSKYYLGPVVNFLPPGRLILRFPGATAEARATGLLGCSLSLTSRLEAIALLVGLSLSSAMLDSSSSPARVSL